VRKKKTDFIQVPSPLFRDDGPPCGPDFPSDRPCGPERARWPTGFTQADVLTESVCVPSRAKCSSRTSPGRSPSVRAGVVFSHQGLGTPAPPLVGMMGRAPIVVPFLVSRVSTSWRCRDPLP